ncbi:ABC transporter ATP-binding protein [Sutcliffiella rhizosphaerae]|uniref:Bacitracin transport ATP-binding protein BcrA n=1 Tax=Sutcliffiella rhizosphaerae TaxID=2880967 RepID=A0ABM8YL79_9BACI|nr:ABC transporter ATP-binding protein [Sutcliffiella rhizosphaerae]CAG9620598.1 Bacitracin transport ATP-binding protein BcrA [Sutcliffiella rhizosphaerae]
MEKVAIKLSNVCKDIGSKQIIKDVSFEVYEGEVFGFLGPNGAGKTTTIRMMVGLMSITSGDIQVSGASIKTNYEKAVGQVGAIVENPEMYKFLTGYQNLMQYARMVPGVAKQRIEDVVNLVGLNGRIHEKVKTYSLGMRQRLGIAQALLHKPKVLILDEPTNGLDPAGIREIRDYLRGLAKEEGMAIVVSSHLLSEMELMCDRVGIIQKGELIDIQTIRDFIQDGKSFYQLDCVPLEKAIEHVIQKEFTYTVVDEKIHMEIDRTEIPELIKSLVGINVDVYGIKEMTKSLEDKFLEKTSEERGA